MSGLADAPLLERIEVRPFSATRALVSARLPHVRLASIWARADGQGAPQ
jgi:hypothetical protein